MPLVRRREGATLAWSVAGIVGLLLLWPALRIPAGVPSPAASAGAVAPWAGSIDPAEGNPTLSDVTFQIQPWLIHLRRELRAGRAPFWNPYQFSGAPFWANGQSAPLFPMHLLFVALPLQLGLVILPWLRVVIAGCGAWVLARELGVGPRASLVSAIVFPLSGMVSSFLLFPMANALCLVPWALVETERLAQGRGAVWRLGAVVALQALGGHPETVAHTVLIAALYLAVRGMRRVDESAPKTSAARAWIGFACATLAGGLVAGAQLVPLLFNVAASTRWSEWSAGEGLPITTALDASLRLVLPDLFGNPADGTWWGPFNYNATSVFAGALALPLAWVGLRDRIDDRRFKALGVTTLIAALAAYHVFPLREVLLLIPVVNRMLHHRLLFVVELGLAIAAAAGVDAIAQGRRRGLASASLVVALTVGAAWWVHRGDWQTAGLVAHQLRWTIWIAIALVVLAAGAMLVSREAGRRHASAFSMIVGLALAVELLMAHARTNPGLDLKSLLPRTPAIEFLLGRPGRMAALDAALRPNAAMIHELHDVRGDDTLKLADYEALYRTFAGESPYFFAPVVDWSAPALDRLGVRWVLAPPRAARPAVSAANSAEWSVAFDGEDARVFERPSAQPMVRWIEGDDRGLTVVAREPGRWTIDYTSASPRVLIVAETWDAGWTATLDGEPLSLQRRQEALIAAHLEAGGGRLELRYRPRGFVAGIVASTVGVLLLAFAAVRR